MLADGTEEGEERWANLLELREVTTRYDDLSAEDALDRLLEETALVADQDSYQSDADMLSLITLHAAKGLEFEVVFIAGLEESLFPTGRAVEAEGGFNPDPRPMEEERRLAYVGMTRARAAPVPVARLAARDAPRPGHELDGRAVAVPARDPGGAHERPAPRRPPRGRRTRGYDAPDDLNLVFGRGATRFGRADPARRRRVPRGERPPRRARGRARPFQPSRDLAARRDAFAGGARSGTFGRAAPSRRGTTTRRRRGRTTATSRRSAPAAARAAGRSTGR